MNSYTTSKKDRQYSGFTESILKNCKTELLTFVFGSAFIAFSDKIIQQDVAEKLLEYVSESRMSNLTSLFSILIGIYVTVLTLLSTTIIGISRRLLKDQMDAQLLHIMYLGLFFNLSATIIGVFVPLSSLKTCLVFLLCTTLSITCFVKFIIIMCKLFTLNMNKMAEDIDTDDHYKSELMRNIENVTVDIHAMRESRNSLDHD